MLYIHIFFKKFGSSAKFFYILFVERKRKRKKKRK